MSEKTPSRRMTDEAAARERYYSRMSAEEYLAPRLSRPKRNISAAVAPAPSTTISPPRGPGLPLSPPPAYDSITPQRSLASSINEQPSRTMPQTLPSEQAYKLDRLLNGKAKKADMAARGGEPWVESNRQHHPEIYQPPLPLPRQRNPLKRSRELDPDQETIVTTLLGLIDEADEAGDDPGPLLAQLQQAMDGTSPDLADIPKTSSDLNRADDEDVTHAFRDQPASRRRKKQRIEGARTVKIDEIENLQLTIAKGAGQQAAHALQENTALQTSLGASTTKNVFPFSSDGSEKAGYGGCGVAYQLLAHRAQYVAIWKGRSYALGRIRDANEAEIYGILFLMKILEGWEFEGDQNLVVIQTDSEHALREIDKSFKSLPVDDPKVDEIAMIAACLISKGMDLRFIWVKRGSTCAGNLIADKLAAHGRNQSMQGVEDLTGYEPFTEDEMQRFADPARVRLAKIAKTEAARIVPQSTATPRAQSGSFSDALRSTLAPENAGVSITFAHEQVPGATGTPSRKGKKKKKAQNPSYAAHRVSPQPLRTNHGSTPPTAAPAHIGSSTDYAADQDYSAGAAAMASPPRRTTSFDLNPSSETFKFGHDSNMTVPFTFNSGPKVASGGRETPVGTSQAGGLDCVVSDTTNNCTFTGRKKKGTATMFGSLGLDDDGLQDGQDTAEDQQEETALQKSPKAFPADMEEPSNFG